MASKQKPNAETKAPSHLSEATKRWFASVLVDYELDPHHVRLLLLAAESWDRCVEARLAIAEHGLTYIDRYGCPKARPECAIERDSRVAFARMVRELRLDIAEPDDQRIPRSSGYGLKLKGAN